jgi:hypothetical protein
MTTTYVLLLLLVVAGLAIFARRAIAQRDALALEKSVNLERQRFLISRMDALSLVLDDRTLSSTEPGGGPTRCSPRWSRSTSTANSIRSWRTIVPSSMKRWPDADTQERVEPARVQSSLSRAP